MKTKEIFLGLMSAAVLTLLMVSCSDYDNGYTESAIKFSEEFKKAYGDIDPEQDWNLAERATVTVNTQHESNIKIYALRGNEYTIVGDYQGVNGTRVLGFDMVEGTTSILVSDGVTGEKTVPGGVVAFTGASTRTVLSPSDNKIQVTKMTQAEEVNGITYPAFRITTNEELHGIFEAVPQSGENWNNGKVTDDFDFISTGSFIIYPSYWYTISNNTLGIYYYDEDGKTKHDVDIYRMHDGSSGELWYTNGGVGKETFSAGEGSGGPKATTANGWTLDNTGQDYFNFQVQTTTYVDGCSMSGNFMEYWRSSSKGLGNATISKTFTGFTANSEYLVKVKARLRNQTNTSTENLGTVTFTANGVSVNMTDANNCSKEVVDNQGNLYSDMFGTKTMWVTCNADDNGNISVEFNLQDVNNANWFSFNELQFMKAAGNDEYQHGDNNSLISTALAMGQGIKVDIPVGRKFGMYLRKTDDSYRFYSESKWNAKNSSLQGTSRWNTPCPNNYASTFYVGDQMFLGFEDWPGPAQGDFDLNDMIFAFDGCKPIVLNEDPETNTWLLVCEDLGGSFDTDYNDVIFRVEHVSGKSTAKITPMAAGGTLASYIVFNDPTQGATTKDYVVGEIHQMFNGVGKEESGLYSPINAYSRYENSGPTVEIPVHENWTIAYNVDADQYTYANLVANNGDFKGVNMGGFCILTLPSGTEVSDNPSVNDLLVNAKASVIAAPGKGDAPYILCLPYTYTKVEGAKTNTYVWAWPQELCTICSATYSNGKYNGANGGAYLDFGAWVSDYTSHKDWYKNKNDNAATVEELVISSQGTSNVTPLGNRGTLPLTAGVGNHREMIINNLTGRSANGTITIRLDSPTNNPWTDGNTLWNIGTRTVYVTDSESGTTSFQIEVKEAKKDPNYGAHTSVVQSGNQWTSWSQQYGNHTINMAAGDRLWIGGIVEGIDGSFYGTLTSFDAGGTESTYAQWEGKSGEYMITTDPNVGGTITVVMHYEGNEEYNAKDVTITINTTKRVKFLHNNLALTYENGGLKLRTKANDANQNWRLVAANKGDGFYYLYNEGAGKYLWVENNTWKLHWEDSPYNYSNGRFTLTSNGYLATAYRVSYSRYFGSTESWADGANVSADTQGSANINWVIETVSSAKQRNAKQRK